MFEYIWKNVSNVILQLLQLWQTDKYWGDSLDPLRTRSKPRHNNKNQKHYNILSEVVKLAYFCFFFTRKSLKQMVNAMQLWVFFLKVLWVGVTICFSDFLIKAYNSPCFQFKPGRSVPLNPFQFLIVCKYVPDCFECIPKCLIKELLMICPNQVLNSKKKKNSRCEQVCFISLLTIHQVNMSDAGNLTCTVQNEAGKNSVTAVLKVVGRFLQVVEWLYLSFICEIVFKLCTCCLSDKPYIKLEPILSSEYKVNGTDIEVMQGDKVELAVQIEAYPEIKQTHWKTPESNNTHEETFNRINNRWVLLFLFL